MERLYLIRVGMERFLGPYTLKQVQESYHKMQFGLQDEISGSLRQWVTFDNIEGVRRHYPELVQLIHSEMMSGWGMSVAPSPSVPNNARMRLGNGSTDFDRPLQTRSFLYLGLFIMVLVALIAFMSYRDGEWVNPIAYLKDRTYYQAKSHLGDRYNARFEGFMDRNRQDISQQMKAKKAFSKWIPYVRSVAFAKDGRWEGVSGKRLKGTADSYLPNDCSVGAWDDRWRESRSQWLPFLEGRILPKDEWARLLMMDTHWIRNRTPMAGWMEPGSYHEACLRMALKSLVKLTSEDASSDSKVIISRMRWQLGGIAGTSPSEEYEMSGTLWATSCLEDAHANDDLKNCFNSVKAKGAWQEFFDGMILIRRMALLAASEAQLSDASLKDLHAYLNIYAGKGSEMFMGYDEEIQFYKEVVQQKGNVKAAKAVVQKKYPGVHFEP
ncbi:MAG: hypothetical protein H7249_05040 [Chitinophagaceae bacterium]|nr:hypothetical protein [Oligoflexus sp.]